MAVTLPTTASKVLAVARREIDTKESPAGSNRTKYGNSFGLDGNPWCAMFVWWVFRKAGAGDLKQLLSTGIAYTPTFAAACKRAGWRSVTVRDAKAGDIVFFDFPDSTFRIQHIGIAERSMGATLSVIEGNTSLTSQDNGGEVMRRTRPASYVEAIYRPIYSNDGGLMPDDVKRILTALADMREKQSEVGRKVNYAAEVGEQCRTRLDNITTILTGVERRVGAELDELRRNGRLAPVALGIDPAKVEGAKGTLAQKGIDPADLPLVQLVEAVGRLGPELAVIGDMVERATGITREAALTEPPADLPRRTG